MQKSDARRRWEIKREVYKGLEDVASMCGYLMLGVAAGWVFLVVLG